MKKRISCMVLAIVLCVGILPVLTEAATVFVSSLDVTMEAPTAGMTLDEGKELKLLSADSNKGELFSTGIMTSLSIVGWEGDFDRSGDKPTFQAGFTYIAAIRLNFNLEKDYMAPYDNATMSTDGSLLSVTVNGNPADVMVSSPGFPTIQVPITIPAPQLTPEQQASTNAARENKFALRHAALRSFGEPYTTAEADSLWYVKNELPVIVLNVENMPEGGYDYRCLNQNYPGQEQLYITKVLLDCPPDSFQGPVGLTWFQEALGISYPNLQEIWASSQVDVATLVKDLRHAVETTPLGGKWYQGNSTALGTARATVYIPASSLEGLLAANDGYMPTTFNIKVYDGDVYAAQQAGDASARDWCTDHQFAAEIMAADRIYRYADCQNASQWFYSCLKCGKCENNPNHTFIDGYKVGDPLPKGTHHYEDRLATDEAYVGVNAAGDHVFWYSCTVCGHAQSYNREHVTEEEYRAAGMDMTYAQYKEFCISDVATIEKWALISAETQPDMFVLSAKSNAKTSTWAQDAVNHALDNNLLDASLLGDDYTKDINRLQFCSVVVRLAEEMTGLEIAPADAATFGDTDNLYVRKAYAAGITTGTSATAFSPSSTLDRQQMATFLYRTLQYIRQNSDIRYTAYESKLGKYTDAWEIASWAKDSLTFMNALDLIIGTSDTTISPLKNCTIEQALTVATRSLYAHQIGWYQVVGVEEKQGFTDMGLANNKYWIVPSGNGATTARTLSYSDRVWVTGNRYGGGVSDFLLDTVDGKYSYYSTYFPTNDPTSGQQFYLEAEWLRPVRD